MNDLQKKLGGIVSSVKSMVNPGCGTPLPKDGDTIGAKLMEATIRCQDVQMGFDDLGRQVAEINKDLNEIYQLLEAERGAKMAEETAAAEMSKAASASPDGKKADKPAEEAPKEEPKVDAKEASVAEEAADKSADDTEK